MRVHSLCGGFFVLSLLFAVSLCDVDPENAFEVVGAGECADCEENHFKTSQAFSGLHVSIDCKLKDGKMERIGFGELRDEGKFKVSIPKTLVDDGQKLKKECYAQLHSAAAVACPAHDGLEAAKIVFKSQTKGIYTFSPRKSLKFSAALCTSKFFWPIFKFPPLPFDPWKKHFHWLLPPPVPVYQPPVPIYKPKPPVYKPKPPVYKPPVPVYKPKPPVPVYKPKPPVPVYKPKPPVYKPPVPVYKPKPPVYKPPVPIYKPKPPVYKPPVRKHPKKRCPPISKPETPVYKPLPPPVRVYKHKPKPPVYKPKPEPPVYKPKPEPPVYKPLPPSVPLYKPKPEPPVVTKPLPPPTPYYPPVIKKPFPPLPKLPPKYLNHPKFRHFPPLPPYHP